MKRNTFDANRDQQVADQHLASQAPCGFCGLNAEREVLTLYGRCGLCYNAYVTGGKPVPPMPTVQERIAKLQRLRAVIAGAAVKRPYLGGDA